MPMDSPAQAVGESSVGIFLFTSKMVTHASGAPEGLVRVELGFHRPGQPADEDRVAPRRTGGWPGVTMLTVFCDNRSLQLLPLSVA